MNLPNMLDAKKRTNKEVKTFDYKKLNITINKTYYLKTYGCQMNEHDSENICGMLENVGFKQIYDINKADVVILNTCAIRENAHNKVFGFLGRVKHIKDNNKNLICVVCGCMAQEENVCNILKDKYPWVNIVIGTHNLDNLINYIDQSIKNSKQLIEVYSKEGDITENIPVKRVSKYTAYVNIILGCDKFCTYCIVPYTRGKQRSRKKENIINEINSLIKEGYKEVVLLGQNVNAYGKDIYDDYNLANLLSDVANTNIDRIRFVTSHPWDFTDDMIKVIKENKNIMPHIHLPVQSGSNRILKLMGRRYNKESYLELVNKLKNNINNLSLTTDIIVGFPTETDEDFKETLDLVNKCEFDSAYTFIYSKRENTPASIMEGQVNESVKKERLQILNEKINYYSNLANQKLLNKTVKVLLISKSEKKDYVLCGYTENMKLVNVKADKSLLGTVQNVKITDVKSFSLDGEVNIK
jgi:tRNA-2-methylthio-N6-dimethylallyladenosine synthase